MSSWPKLFFASIRHVFSEQQYVDWVFKTSFLNAIHNIGTLASPPNYKNDNLETDLTITKEAIRNTLDFFILCQLNNFDNDSDDNLHDAVLV